jgi:Zn-dependent protease with chaperone function
MQKYAGVLLASLIFAILLCATGCISSAYVPPDMSKYSMPKTKVCAVSKEQIARLTELTPGKATRDDVIKILGEPSFEGPMPRKEEVAGAMGKDCADLFYDENIEKEKRGMMMYYLSDFLAGEEIAALMVLVNDASYQGYLWCQKRADYLSEEMLNKAREFANGKKAPTPDTLLKTFGPPCVFGLSKSGIGWSYAFIPPREIANLDIRRMRGDWLVDKSGTMRFIGMTPEYVYAKSIQDAGVGKQGDMSSDKNKKVIEAFLAMVENEKKTLKPCEDSKQAERVLTIVNRLLKASPQEVPPFTTLILQSKELNAFAVRSKNGYELIIHTALLDSLGDDSLLAWAIGHEIGHMVAGHTFIPIKFLEDMDPQFYRWSQLMEYEADLKGAELATLAGYNPEGALSTLKILRDNSPAPPAAYEKFSSHTPEDLRVEMLKWYINFREMNTGPVPGTP